MRILYISQYFPPEIGATQNRAYEMAKNLIRNGHQVTVLTEVPNHPAGVIHPAYRGKRFVKEFYEDIPVFRSWVYTKPHKTFTSRILFYASFLVTATLAALFMGKKRFDVLYVTSPPLMVGLVGVVLSKWWRVPFFFEVRDLWPESAVALGELNSERYIRIGHGIADLCYRNARAIVGVTNGIVERLKKKPHIPEEKVALIKNGTNPDRIRCAPDPELRRELGWGGDFVVLYAGIHGVAQGLESVLDAAHELKSKKNIRFVFIGAGPNRSHIVASARRRHLTNTTFLQEIPGDRIGRYIALADVCLVPLRKNQLFKGALPSKIFDSWACSKPVLLSVDGEARLEVEAAQGGLFVEPENVREMVRAVRYLEANRRQCVKMGENGHRYLYSNGYIRSQQARQLGRLLAQAAVRRRAGQCSPYRKPAVTGQR